MSTAIPANADDLDFSRYAPEPRLVWDNPQPPTSDDLKQLRKVIASCLGLAWTCIGASITIMRRRAWAKFETHVVQSLFSAWVVAGTGWGLCLVASAGLVALLTQ